MSTQTKSSGTLLTPDKKKISYRHYQNGRQRVILIAHGFYNSKDAILLKKIADNLSDDYDVFMFDFRGHGKSSGLYSWTSKEEKDLGVVLNHLRPEYKKIGIIAFSLGASICINFLAKSEIADSLVCVSSPSEFDKIDYKFWKLDLKEDLFYTLFTKEGRKGRGFRAGPFWLKKKKPIDNVGELKIPILYIHGEKDWVIKPWHSRALFEKTTAKKKLVIIKNGTHAEYLMKRTSKEFMNPIKEWFAETL